jgi:hypothetical protein
VPAVFVYSSSSASTTNFAAVGADLWWRVLATPVTLAQFRRFPDAAAVGAEY